MEIVQNTGKEAKASNYPATTYSCKSYFWILLTKRNIAR